MCRSSITAILCLSLVLGLVASWGQLAAAEAELTAKTDGWQELFNGQDFTGWQNAGGGKPGSGWVVQEGAMCRKQAGGDVWSKDRFGDFVLDMEFKTEGNSGIFIRTDNPKDCVQTGLEIQVYTPVLKPSKHSCGALYDAQTPSKEVAKKDWNHAVITARDNKITIVLNGQQIIDMDLNQWAEAGKNPDGAKNKFRTALKDFKREGHIGLQDHGAVVAYRNIRIKAVK